MSILSAIRLIVALVLVAAVASYRQPARAQMESREAIALQNQILDLRRADAGAAGPGGSGRWRQPDLSRPGRLPPPAGGSE